MKKRMIALMLAGIMVLSVTACGGGGASSKNQNNYKVKTPYEDALRHMP